MLAHLACTTTYNVPVLLGYEARRIILQILGFSDQFAQQFHVAFAVQLQLKTSHDDPNDLGLTTDYSSLAPFFYSTK